MTSTCPQCGADLESPLACAACGSLFRAPDGASPFELLGLAPTFELDERELRARLLRLSRAMHPDFFGSAPEEVRALAQHNTAEVNTAHEALADPFRRAGLVLRHLGGPDESAERQMPQAFLMEVMEWNETLEEAREAAPDSAPRTALEALRGELRERRAGVMSEVGALLGEQLVRPTPQPERLTDARRLLNAVRYLDRTLSEMEALRLAQASSR